MKAHYLNEHCNEYNVTCNEVKVPKTGQNFTLLKVKVFPFFNTSLKVKVLKLLLKYSNALLLLRYCTTLVLTRSILHWMSFDSWNGNYSTVSAVADPGFLAWGSKFCLRGATYRPLLRQSCK